MPRQPKLRKKQVGNSVYWFTKAGGDTYFGTLDEVAFKDAKKQFADHVQSLQDEREDSKKGFTAGDLIDLFLEWINDHRSKPTYTTRTLYCSRFASLMVGNARLKELPANKQNKRTKQRGQVHPRAPRGSPTARELEASNFRVGGFVVEWSRRRGLWPFLSWCFVPVG